MIEVSPDDPRFGLGYAVAAYVVIFVALFGYLAYMHLCWRRVSRRLAEAERELRSRGGTLAD